MRQGVFFCVCFGFLAGVAGFSIRQVLSIRFLVLGHLAGAVSFQFLVVSVAMVLFGLVVRKRFMRSGLVIILVAVFLLAGFLGLVRAASDAARENPEVLARHVGARVSATGIISNDPDYRENYTRLIIRTDTVESEPATTNILVTTSPYTSFVFGDRVQIAGKLRVPENFITDAGREFDYINYLRKDYIYYQMSFADIYLLDNEQENLENPFFQYSWLMIKRGLFRIKRALVDSIDRLFPQPEGALLAGVLFGEQSGLGTGLQEYFRKTGVIHIVVLSGFNVTIVALFIVWILGRFIRPRIALVFGILGIIGFVILVGAGASVVRAGAMAILAIIARLLGRENEIGRALVLAATIMTLHNPRVLMFDISFQLSFLATLGVVYVAPLFDRLLVWIPETFTLRETVVGTLSAQVFVSPLLLYAIGEFSIVSPLVNILVVPFVSLTMLFGFIAAVVGLVLPQFALLFMIPTYLILHIQIKMVEFFGSLPFASLIVPRFPMWMVIVSYILLGLAFIKKRTTI